MKIVKFCRIHKINFKDISTTFLGGNFSPVFQMTFFHPLEVSNRQCLWHSPTVKIVSIKILDKFRFFFQIEILHILVVSLRISFRNHRDSTKNSFFNHYTTYQHHSAIQALHQFSTCIPGQSWSGEIPTRIKPIIFQANASKAFKDIC